MAGKIRISRKTEGSASFEARCKRSRVLCAQSPVFTHGPLFIPRFICRTSPFHAANWGNATSLPAFWRKTPCYPWERAYPCASGVHLVACKQSGHGHYPPTCARTRGRRREGGTRVPILDRFYARSTLDLGREFPRYDVRLFI